MQHIDRELLIICAICLILMIYTKVINIEIVI